MNPVGSSVVDHSESPKAPSPTTSVSRAPPQRAAQEAACRPA